MTTVLDAIGVTVPETDPDARTAGPGWAQEIRAFMERLGLNLDGIPWEADYLGVEDATDFIQDCLDTNDSVCMNRPGTYLVSALDFNTGNRLWLGRGVVLLRTPDASGDMLRLYDVEDVVIEGPGKIDGNRENYTGYHGSQLVGIRGASKRITLRDFTARGAQGATAIGGAGGDGIYIATGNGTTGTNAAIPEDIYLENVKSRENVRQAMSVIAVRRLKAVGCKFNDTVGSDPGGGVDFEPNSATPSQVRDGDTETFDLIEDVELIGCDFVGNYKGITSSGSAGATMRNLSIVGGLCADNTSPDRGIFLDGFTGARVKGMTVRDNLGNGIEFSSSGNFGTVEGCIVYGNAGNGIKAQYRGCKIIGNTVYLNGLHGIYLAYKSPVPSGHVCTDNLVFNNSTLTNNTYSGIYHSGNASAQNQGSIISNNQCINSTAFDTTAQQANGIRLDPDVKQCVLVGNRGTGNLTADFNIVEDEQHEFSSVGSAATLKLGAGLISALTRSAPSAPADNRGELYVDTSGGKDRWRALFATGASQAVATEP